MDSRPLIYSVLVLALLAATGFTASAATLKAYKDNGLVAEDTLMLVTINMSSAVTVAASSTSPVYVVLNVTIPQGFELLYVNVTYNASEATPVSIVWDPVNRNLTINVSVTVTPYNDLNATLALVPRLPKGATGKLNATYYYNVTTSYVVLSSGTLTLSVNGTAVPANTTPYRYSYPAYRVYIAGTYGLKAIRQLLNNIQLSWINETALANRIVAIYVNASNSFTYTEWLDLTRVSTSISARFGNTVTSAPIIGLEFVGGNKLGVSSGVGVTAPVPVTGNFTLVAFTGVDTNYVEINSTYIVIAGGMHSGISQFNFSKLFIMYDAEAADAALVLNATAPYAEAHMVHVDASAAEIDGVNSANAVPALLYALASNISTMTLSTAWKAMLILSEYQSTLSSGTIDCAFCNLLPVLQPPYNTSPTAIPVEFDASIPVSTGSLVEAAFAPVNVTALASTSIELPVLINPEYIESIRVVARIPSRYTQAFSEAMSTTAPSLVAVVDARTEPIPGVCAYTSTPYLFYYYAYYEASNVTYIDASVSGPEAAKLYIIGRLSPAAILVEGAGYGNETILVKVRLPLPALPLLCNAFNVSMTLPPASKPVMVGVVIPSDASLAIAYPFQSPLTISKTAFINGALNITVNMTSTIAYDKPPVTSDIEVLVAVKMPNATGNYTLSAGAWDTSSGYVLAINNTLTYRVVYPDTMNIVYFYSPTAFRMYLDALNGLITRLNALDTPPHYYYVTMTTRLPGKLGLLADMPLTTEYGGGAYIDRLDYTTDGVVAFIGVNGVHRVDFIVLNVTGYIAKVCLRNVILSVASIFAVNSTSQWISTVDIENSQVTADKLALNASTIYVYGSSFTTTTRINLSSEYNATYVSTGIRTPALNVYRGSHYMLYSSINATTVNVYDAAELKIILPTYTSPAAEAYVIESVPGVSPAASASTLVTGTSASVTAGRVAASIEYTTTPATPTIVTLAELQGTNLPPGTGVRKAADLAIIGATPAKITISFIVWPACTTVPPKTLLANTKVYFYNATSGKWNLTKPADMTLDPTTCTLTVTFDNTSPLKPSMFTGLTIGVTAPTRVTVVGIQEFEPYTPPARPPITAYAAAAAILTTILAISLASRKQRT